MERESAHAGKGDVPRVRTVGGQVRTAALNHLGKSIRSCSRLVGSYLPMSG